MSFVSPQITSLSDSRNNWRWRRNNLLIIQHSKFWNICLVLLISEESILKALQQWQQLDTGKEIGRLRSSQGLDKRILMMKRQQWGQVELKDLSHQFLEMKEVQEVTGMEEIIRSMKEKRSVAAGITAEVVEVALGDGIWSQKGGQKGSTGNTLEDGGNCRRISWQECHPSTSHSAAEVQQMSQAIFSLKVKVIQLLLSKFQLQQRGWCLRSSSSRYGTLGGSSWNRTLEVWSRKCKDLERFTAELDIDSSTCITGPS